MRIIFKYHGVRCYQEGECLIFAGKAEVNGYGKLGRGGKTYLAHKYIYEKVKKVIVPEHLQLDHNCKRRKCINENHLEEVTNKVNSRRSRQSKLTLELVAQAKAEFTGKHGDIQRLATKYGVNRITMLYALRGKTWN